MTTHPSNFGLNFQKVCWNFEQESFCSSHIQANIVHNPHFIVSRHQHLWIEGIYLQKLNIVKRPTKDIVRHSLHLWLHKHDNKALVSTKNQLINLQQMQHWGIMRRRSGNKTPHSSKRSAIQKSVSSRSDISSENYIVPASNPNAYGPATVV